MGAFQELDDILKTSTSRHHYLYHERKQGKLWVFTHREPCFCYINENHWVERIV